MSRKNHHVQASFFQNPSQFDHRNYSNINMQWAVIKPRFDPIKNGPDPSTLEGKQWALWREQTKKTGKPVVAYLEAQAEYIIKNGYGV